MEELKNKILGLDRSKFHIILVQKEDFSPDKLEELSKGLQNQIQCLIVVVRNMEDMRVLGVENGTFEVKDGKLINAKIAG